MAANRNEEETKQIQAYHTRSFKHGIKQGRRQKQQIHDECCEKAENKRQLFLARRLISCWEHVQLGWHRNHPFHSAVHYPLLIAAYHQHHRNFFEQF